MADGAPELAAPASVIRVQVREEGGEQFVVLPESFRIDAEEVILRRQGDALLLEPAASTHEPQTDEEWSRFWTEIDDLCGDDRLSPLERETPGEPDFAA